MPAAFHIREGEGSCPNAREGSVKRRKEDITRRVLDISLAGLIYSLINIPCKQNYVRKKISYSALLGKLLGNIVLKGK